MNGTAVIGPYHNLLGTSTGNWYLVPDLRVGQVVWVFVRDGNQRSEGLPFPSKQDAYGWIRDNGFDLCK
jgi:hypothetical protein